jgi:hypothetical protein
MVDGSSDVSAAPPLIGVDGAGTATIVWFDGGVTLAARRMTVEGRLELPVTVGTPDTIGDSFRVASLGVDAAGNATVAWQRVIFDSSYPHGGTIISASVYARRLRADGNLGPVLGLETGPAQATDPRVAVPASGRAIVAWRSYDHYGNYAVRMATVESDGTLMRSPDVYNSTAFASGPPALAAGPAGEAVAAWTHGPLLARSVALGESGPVATLDPEGASSIATAVDESGVASVVWTVTAGDTTQIRARHVGLTGQPGRLLRVYETQDRVKGLSVAVDPAGDVIAAWTRIRRARPHVYSVKARAVGAHDRLGKLRTLASGTRQFLSSPDVGADADGTVTVAWADRVSKRRVKSVIRVARTQ